MPVKKKRMKKSKISEKNQINYGQNKCKKQKNFDFQMEN